ncbi:Alpha/Beta hydrolase protein [Staphylotrichum tortipilum]|uniref:Alpha/Beta hydrolase protein n=1 Tax=Staphylotrichum tortipilum TaxID=2831512 RepID=A0AAN6MI36_9PEZI|nr:Alpha/Beta hydrolase protein [Staphylotrichum longicolle]
MATPAEPTPTLPLSITTIPPTTPHTHTLIFLHGRGDTVPSFIRALHNWSSSTGHTLFSTFPSVKWVFPQAPLRTVANSGRPAGAPPLEVPQWFDVWSPRDFREREELQLEGLREVVPAVKGLVEKEVEGLGRERGKVVLAGISMGAATGVHTLLNMGGDKGLGGFMGFCARCPFAGRGPGEMRGMLGIGGVEDGDGVVKGTPVLLEHNVGDPLVVIEKGRELRDALKGFGMEVQWREYVDYRHWFHEPEGVDDVIEFLEKTVGVPKADLLSGLALGGQQAQAPAGSDKMGLS